MRRHPRHVVRGQPPQRERGQMGHHGPGRVKLRARGQDETQPRLGALVNEQAQQLHRGGIEPVQVFHHQEDRLPLRFGVQPGQQRVKGVLALLARREGQRRVGRGQGERQQRCQQGHRLRQHDTRRGQHGFQRAQSLGRRIVGVPPQPAVQIVDDGRQGTLLEIGRAAPLHPGVRLGSHSVCQHLHQARFTNARLAAEQYHLAQPRGGLLPAPVQERHFFVPAHQWRQAARRDDVEPGLRPTRLQRPRDLEGLGDAFELLRPERLAHKIARDQPRGRRTDHDRIRGRQTLEACRNVRRLPQG